MLSRDPGGQVSAPFQERAQTQAVPGSGQRLPPSVLTVQVLGPGGEQQGLRGWVGERPSALEGFTAGSPEVHVVSRWEGVVPGHRAGLPCSSLRKNQVLRAVQPDSGCVHTESELFSL